jgi:hypothetical protein
MKPGVFKLWVKFAFSTCTAPHPDGNRRHARPHPAHEPQHPVLLVQRAGGGRERVALPPAGNVVARNASGKVRRTARLKTKEKEFVQCARNIERRFGSESAMCTKYERRFGT